MLLANSTIFIFGIFCVDDGPQAFTKSNCSNQIAHLEKVIKVVNSHVKRRQKSHYFMLDLSRAFLQTAQAIIHVVAFGRNIRRSSRQWVSDWFSFRLLFLLQKQICKTKRCRTLSRRRVLSVSTLVSKTLRINELILSCKCLIVWALIAI